MSRFPRRNQEILKQGDLEDDGLQSVCLRDYQLEGVSWMKKCFDDKHGCILGDEMGLGKTVQVRKNFNRRDDLLTRDRHLSVTIYKDASTSSQTESVECYTSHLPLPYNINRPL